jgi:thiamine-phosphate pyrophosphorylase
MPKKEVRKKMFRIIDANINRVSEGLRVIEDIQRFIYDNEELSKELREMRHQVRKSFYCKELLENRNSIGDIGLNISKESLLDQKHDIEDLLISNFKRVEEGLRSIEEALKVIDQYKESKAYENLRFQAYNLEKKILLRKNVLDTDIYAILGEEFSKGRNNIEITKELILAHVKIIQYREKSKTSREKYEECKEIRRLTKEKGVTFIVNDDVSIALAVKSDGIHIGQEDMPIEEVRKIAPNMIIGLSTHNKEQAKYAVEKGADYIGVGPIFNTTTKKNIEKSEGLEYLKWVKENIKLPYVAIGGIKEENISTLKEYGGYCFAMISELTGAENIVDKVKSIREKLR